MNMNKIFLIFQWLSVFYVPYLMGSATDNPEITLVESIYETLHDNLQNGGSTTNDINGLLRQLDEVQKENAQLKKEVQSLNEKICTLELQRTPWNPKKRIKNGYDEEKPVSFNASPFDVPSLIYTMYVTDPDNNSLIPHFLRVDATKLDVGPITEKNLFQATLEVEEHLLKIISKNPAFVRRTIYVGLTKGTLNERFKAHLSDSRDEVKKSSSNKVIHIERALKLLFNVKVSNLIYRIPEAFLEHFECLVADIFLAQEKGSARIATRAAWEKYLNYKNSPERVLYLTDKGLIDVVKNIANEEFRRKINYSPIEIEEAAQVPTPLQNLVY